MVDDVKDFCRTCDKFQRANRFELLICNAINVFNCMTFALIFRKFDEYTAELHPIPVKDEVWHTIGVDLIGPLPETPRGNKYILTISCFFLSGPKQQLYQTRQLLVLLSFYSSASQDTAAAR